MSDVDPAAPKSKGDTLGDASLPVVSPDEQEMNPEVIDNIVPSRGYQLRPMVGIGGSAGSIPALQAFFEAMPADSGMTFVVVLHLSPDHESSLPELLQRCTKMAVSRAEDGAKAEPNTVYVIPPRKHLTAVDNRLRLTAINGERGRRVAVDLFFRSLADSHGPHATAIVLSGADGDGALGVKRIKERGGLTIAQAPAEAEHGGMPGAAIGTDMVDWVLPVREMPRRILEYHAHEARLKLPSEDGPQPARRVSATPDETEAAMREVLVLLRSRTGRDFTYYKRATIVRRISRRMQINSIDDVPGYLEYLRTHPGEAGALLQDLLISVTNFFRDREAFDALETHLPALFNGKSSGDTVRVWVPACASGEEAYSIAILLLEHSCRLDSPPRLQLFGCDLDEEAIEVARAGIYPLTIAADVSEERLLRFFVKEGSGYRVKRKLREMVLFAAHDLLKDAPFSRIDLISCRNLFIYLHRDAQQRALHTFHFALKRKGLLFLGSAESMEDDNQLFEPLDKKYRIYLRRPAETTHLPIPLGPSLLVRSTELPQRVKEVPGMPGQTFLQNTNQFPAGLSAAHEQHVSLNELHFKLLERFGPPSIVVSAEHEVVHLSDRANRFLLLPGGEPTKHLLRMAHPMLRAELRAALFRAAESNAPVEVPDVPFSADGKAQSVNIRVAPAEELAAGFFLVLFEEHEIMDAEVLSAANVRIESEPLVQHLERELEQTKQRLHDTVERYEASTEELKAGNEELTAMNEELRSAGEELETSREELQSVNEELTTVNHELKRKVDELDHANSDMQNLMASTAIATVFLDRGLRIMRYTPSAVKLFRIIPGDVGRPLADLRHSLEYAELTADALRVLEQLIPVEREVRSDGQWFLARLLPYRTLADQIAGVVLTLVDITEGKRAQEAQRISDERLRLIVEGAKDFAIFTLDPERRVTSWSPGAEELFEYTEAEILGQGGDILFVPEDQETGEPAKEAERAICEGRAENERWHLRKNGSRFFGSGVTRPLGDASGATIGFVKILRDLTEQMQSQEALRASEQRLQRIVNVPRVGVLTFDYSGVMLHANDAFLEMVGYDREEFGSQKFAWRDFTPSEFIDASTRMMEQITQTGRGGPYEKQYFRKDGTRLWLMFVAADLGDGSFVEYAIDVSDRKRAEEALRANEEQFRRAIEDAPIPVIMQAEDGQVLQISNTWTELTGYTREDIPTFDAWLTRAYGPGADEVREHMHRLFRGAVDQLDVEIDVSTRFGEVRRWAFSASVPGRLRDGRRYIVGMALDITERRRVEEALRESQERLRLIVENAREYVIFSMDTERRITSWNAGAQAILGYSPEEATGQYGDLIFTPEDRAAGVPEHETEKALLEGRAADERWHLRKDGSRFWGSGVMTAMRDAQGNAIGFVKIFRDETEELEAKTSLEHSREQLRSALQETERARIEVETAGRTKDHFLAVLSHELRTPLNPVLIATSILLRRKDLPPGMAEMVEMMQRNVKLEAQFIDELLDLTRITRGKIELNCEPLDLHSTVWHAVQVSDPDIQAKNQQLVVMLGAQETQVLGDPTRLQQVFWNLLKNASKFTPEKGEIRISSRNEPGQIVIEIRDNGIGFEPEAADRIFDAFEQANRDVTREFGGLGLGLAISRATVNAHGGTIQASSAGDSWGATFTVALPLIVENGAAETNE